MKHLFMEGAHAEAALHRANDILDALLCRYRRTHVPITVNFRDLVSWVRPGERATHFIHPYPAKLLPQIPALFLSNTLLSAPGDIVLDPFCGSGTVLLEATLHSRPVIGVDSNPLARLIASAKITNVEPSLVEEELTSVLRQARRIRRASSPDVVNLAYWFYPHVIRQLSRLRSALEVVRDDRARTFLEVCFSACVRRVSLADPRLSVPVRLKKNQYPSDHPFRTRTNARMAALRRQDVLQTFELGARQNISRLAAYLAIRPPNSVGRVAASDARALLNGGSSRRAMESGSVQLVVTSPPYAGAQKYVRSSSLSLGWLDLMNGKTLRQLEDCNIGREHLPRAASHEVPTTGIVDADRRLSVIANRNMIRARIAATYLVEMREAFTEIVRVLRPGGFLVLVAGNNRVCGSPFRTVTYLQAILEELGLSLRLRLVDSIRSRGLMTRRNSTAGIITRVWVLVFEQARG